MRCETCPIRYHCDAYDEAERDNDNSYHHQTVVRVPDYSELGCPLLKLIKKDKRCIPNIMKLKQTEPKLGLLSDIFVAKIILFLSEH